MALNIIINKVSVAASFAAGATVATAVASGGTAPYVYSLATGGDKFAINSSTGVVTTIAAMDITNIASFSVTATDSTTGTALTITSDVIYPPIQAAIKSKFGRTNMIYKITKDINLGHGVLTIPEGCTLDFQGGRFSNGILKFLKETKIVAPSIQIFYNITIDKESVPYSNEIDVHWWGAKGDGVTNDTKAIQYAINSIRVEGLNTTPYYDRVTLLAKSSKPFIITNTLIFDNAENHNQCDIDIDVIQCNNPNITAIYIDRFYKSEIKIKQIIKQSEYEGVYKVNWSNRGSVGIVFKHLFKSNVHIGEIEGFTKGVIVLADGADHGVSKNYFYVNEIMSCHEGFIIKSLNGGWPNGNHFTGSFHRTEGSFNTAGINTRIIDIKFENDGSYAADSWTFENTIHFRNPGHENTIIDGKYPAVLYVESKNNSKGIRYCQFTNVRAESISPDNTAIYLNKNCKNIVFTTNLYTDPNFDYLKARYIEDETECDNNVFRFNNNYLGESEYLRRQMPSGNYSLYRTINTDELFNKSFKFTSNGTITNSINDSFIVNGAANIVDAVGDTPNYKSYLGAASFILDLTKSFDIVFLGNKGLNMKLLDANLKTINSVDDLGNYIQPVEFVYNTKPGNISYRKSSSGNVYWWRPSNAEKNPMMLNIKSTGESNSLKYLEVFLTCDYAEVYIKEGSNNDIFYNPYSGFDNYQIINVSLQKPRDIFWIPCNVGTIFYSYIDKELYKVIQSGTTGVLANGSGNVIGNVITLDNDIKQGVFEGMQLEYGQISHIDRNLKKIYLVKSYSEETVTFSDLNFKSPIIEKIYKDKGFSVFDFNINKPKWWTGEKWVDATGTPV